MKTKQGIGTRVAQTSESSDLSRLGSGERDCGSEATARPGGPSGRERASQSQVSKPASHPRIPHAGSFHAPPIWKSAIKQVCKPALRCFSRSALKRYGSGEGGEPDAQQRVPAFNRPHLQLRNSCF